jgi:hypothetical protein
MRLLKSGFSFPETECEALVMETQKLIRRIWRLCRECNTPCYDLFMVLNRLWNKYGCGNGVLHLTCMERRMGRVITPSDLTDAPCNDALRVMYRNGKGI